MAYIHQGHTTFPLRLGHEWTGRVVAAGSPDDDAWIGKRVTGDTMLGCGHCDAAARATTTCARTARRSGSAAAGRAPSLSRCSSPTRFAFEIPERDVVTAAALVEPAGNSLRAVRAAALQPGQSVLVLGSGTIGLLAAQFALAEGADVHVAGVREPSLEFARSLGVAHTWQLDDLADGRENEFDAVIECTSVEAMPALAVDAREARRPRGLHRPVVGAEPRRHTRHRAERHHRGRDPLGVARSRGSDRELRERRGRARFDRQRNRRTRGCPGSA